MKKFKFQYIFGISLTIGALPIAVISCKNENTNNTIDHSIFNINKNSAHILDSSQLQQIHKSLSFSLSLNGKKLKKDEIVNKLKKIRESIYPVNKKVDFNREITFNSVLEHEDFKKYFKFEKPGNNKFSFLKAGHIFEMELVLNNPKNDTPAIFYSLYCPDRIQNGRMSKESSGYIILDNNDW